ncbi:FKBP-type peptidyl-prolyl cis-trans isomerase [Arthrobacter sp. AK01]|uniref:FKBP-type peptidyl-prolyl cis-trans isomerase n=1 Tax=Micrococcaceae TaxID=1268 RepID=UPI001E29C38E|nr:MULTISPECIES: FKBP-type peptidyl-prolyl cis-trans isomerase [Micrococcaceae]MCD4851035.1 FKBP-type peptidyl-prolyl cis-trans isomerase [Arthrobacter sp. AK01]MCP1414136.1 peptidylprolyl isomerase [Paenarthrobacter sp. A20]
MRRLLAILLPALLLITACGGSTPAAEPTSQSAGDTSKLDSVKVTDNGDKAPGVEFSKPLTVTEPTIKMVVEGDGERVKAGQTAELMYLAVDGNDGKTVEDAYANGPQPIELTDELKTGNEQIYNAIVGAKVGSQIAFAAPGNATASAPASTQLVVFKLVSAKDPAPVLEKPEGETVTPPAGLPTVKEDDKGIPQISVEGVAAPKELIAQDLIKGTGAAVKASDTLTVNYVGVTLAGGTKFDSSYDRGESTSFPLTGVIKGWTQGLEGKTVGSRVLLVIPQDLAYGEAGQGEAKGDLVFVVDILGVK